MEAVMRLIGKRLPSKLLNVGIPFLIAAMIAATGVAALVHAGVCSVGCGIVCFLVVICAAAIETLTTLWWR